MAYEATIVKKPSESYIAKDDISRKVLDCAFEVHRQLGPGLLENAYEECLSILLIKRNIPFKRQVVMPLYFEEQKIDVGYRLDILAGDDLIIEIKACDKLIPLHEAQLLTYMRLSNIKAGLLINFNEKLLKNGLKRMVL